MENTISDTLKVSGFIDTDIMCHSVSIIDKKLNALNIPRKYITKTKLVATELVQNAIRHGVLSNMETIPFFNVDVSSKGEILLVMGNPISENIKNELSERIRTLEKLSGQEITELYKQSLSRACLDMNDNAGLGLLTIFLRSESNINCDFTTQNNNHYFTISATINFN